MKVWLSCSPSMSLRTAAKPGPSLCCTRAMGATVGDDRAGDHGAVRAVRMESLGAKCGGAP